MDYTYQWWICQCLSIVFNESKLSTVKLNENILFYLFFVLTFELLWWYMIIAYDWVHIFFCCSFLVVVNFFIPELLEHSDSPQKPLRKWLFLQQQFPMGFHIYIIKFKSSFSIYICNLLMLTAALIIIINI